MSAQAAEGYDSRGDGYDSRGDGSDDVTSPNGGGSIDHDENEKAKLPRGDNVPQNAQEEKEQMMRKANAGKKDNKVEYKGERVVKDPVTGRDVIVKDADFGGERPCTRHWNK